MLWNFHLERQFELSTFLLGVKAVIIMKRGIRKFVTHMLIMTAFALSGLAAAQEAQSPVHAYRTATVSEMQIAGSYVYILVAEEGEEVWLATSPGFVKDIKYGDVIEFFGEVEMQEFHSNALDRTFKTIWFVSRIRVKPKEAVEGSAAEPTAH
jgi:hypothetical protein